MPCTVHRYLLLLLRLGHHAQFGNLARKASNNPSLVLLNYELLVFNTRTHPVSLQILSLIICHRRRLSCFFHDPISEHTTRCQGRSIRCVHQLQHLVPSSRELLHGPNINHPSHYEFIESLPRYCSATQQTLKERETSTQLQCWALLRLKVGRACRATFITPYAFHVLLVISFLHSSVFTKFQRSIILFDLLA